MDKFLSAIAVGFLSAITYVAYKHPTGFKRLYFPMAVLVVSGVCSIGAFSVGIQYAIDKLGPLIRTPQSAAALAQLQHSINSATIAVLIVTVASFYVVFLLFLPEILKEEKPKPKRGDQE